MDIFAAIVCVYMNVRVYISHIMSVYEFQKKNTHFG
jgi:uncharacterized membrane protein